MTTWPILSSQFCRSSRAGDLSPRATTRPRGAIAAGSRCGPRWSPCGSLIRSALRRANRISVHRKATWPPAAHYHMGVAHFAAVRDLHGLMPFCMSRAGNRSDAVSRIHGVPALGNAESHVSALDLGCSFVFEGGLIRVLDMGRGGRAGLASSSSSSNAARLGPDAARHHYGGGGMPAPDIPTLMHPAVPRSLQPWRSGVLCSSREEPSGRCTPVADAPSRRDRGAVILPRSC